MDGFENNTNKNSDENVKNNIKNDVDNTSYLEYNTNNLSDMLDSDLLDDNNGLDSKILNDTNPFILHEPEKNFDFKKIKRLFKKFFAAAILIIGCAAAGLFVGVVIPRVSSFLQKNDSLVSGGMEEIASDDALSDLNKEDSPLKYASFSNVKLIKKVRPSIVCITSTVEAQGFFNMNYESDGSGSGIIFSKDADNVYIVTNCHVIEGAKKVSISLDSGNFVSAKLVGKNVNADLAVISVSIAELKAQGVDDVKPISFGDSDKVNPGSSVIAIGNALGEGNIATSGVVSVVNKEVAINGKQLTVIQTDAAINPGNSGGALLNSKGEVVGINTAKLATESVEGVGYSITSNMAKPIIEKLMNNQDTPFLGVYISDISEEIANSYNIPQTGVMITQIIPNSSASASDLRETDIITGIDDTPIFAKEQLIDAVSNYKIGDVVAIKIIRDGKFPKTVSVKLIANPDSGF